MPSTPVYIRPLVRAIDAYEELRRLVMARSVHCTEERGASHGRGDDARAAWQAFQSLMTVPADEPFTTRWGIQHLGEDLLMFEAVEGEPQDGDDGLLLLLFTRHFSFEGDDGDYSYTNSLTLEVQAVLPPELAGAKRPIIWGAAGPPGAQEPWATTDLGPYHDAPHWAMAVERTDAFAAAFAQAPIGFNFSQSDM